MRTLLISAAVLLCTAASAQTAVQVNLRFANGTESVSVSPRDCGNRRVVVTWTASGTACQELAVWLTEGTECKETADAQTTRYSLTSVTQTTLNQTRTGTLEFSVSSLPFSAPTDGGTRSCGVGDVEQEFRVCGSTKATDFYTGACSTTVTKASPGKIVYDSKAPEPPTIESVAQLDKALRVEVAGTSDVNEVRLVALRDGNVVSQQTRGPGSIQVEGLENEVTYQLEAYAIDAAGNESSSAATAEGTPIKTLGFYEKYREAGGKETGGCGATGGGLAGSAVLTALGFWLFSRRNRS
ncbi:MAG TPA: MXAN_2561 family MXYO-CTERM-anchored protein [Archangium sp.]|jgi:hypothetical protein|uniref:MXAN_2561 family MXYO-CTERM-anchored protein n=1 Tax=Archangium sp. TaxID=1872627 RepID=UPI002ED813E4